MSDTLAIATADATPTTTGAAVLSVQAERAARVMMRKSPETQRTYQGIYIRFAAWLANRDGVSEASVAAFTPEAFVAYLDEREAIAAPSTVKKERAALRKLARYLHQLRLIDATVILMVEIPTVNDTAPARQGLDRATWERVLALSRARLTKSARSRCSAAAATRDLALIHVLGGAGLRSGETRSLPLDPFDQGRSDNHGGALYLRVHGKGHKVRSVPLYSDIATALESWRKTRDEIPELVGDPWLFPQLGRGRRDGSFPDAGGELSTTAVIKIVRPIMLAAGVPPQQAHPHTLRHTFGRLYMAAPGAELSRLQRIMGHASPETTSRYVHHADIELAAEHRRIERLQHDPLARRQQQRRERAGRRSA
jgi:site-specific recombinase XerD